MTLRLPSSLVIAAIIAMPLCLGACETSHDESTKQNLLGGTTHQETTTTRNPITGTVTSEQSKEVTH